MNTRNDLFASLMRSFGRQFGEDIVLSEHGVATFLLDNVEISIECPEEGSFACFHAPVTRLGPNRESQLLRALGRNLFALPVANLWLAFDEVTDELVLCHAAPLAGLMPDDLALGIERMAALVVMLRDDLQGEVPELSSGEPLSSTPTHQICKTSGDHHA